MGSSLLIVADLSASDLARALGGEGLRLRTGPFVSAIRSSLPAVTRGIALHYAAHSVEEDGGFADFHVGVDAPRTIRRWIQPQVLFEFDGAKPFRPLPATQAFPMLEWGLNWCVSSQAHQYLAIHAAVVERGGRAVVLPAPPGSGKSTLCAGLVARGWRLLSDELTLLDPRTGKVTPLPRPVSLKNASIEVIRAFAPDAVLGPVVEDTVKGAVAHMKPPADSVRRTAEPAQPRWIVVPRFLKGERARLTPLPPAPAFMKLADSAFNYAVYGRLGFAVLAGVVDAAESYELSYGDLDEAAAIFEELAGTA